MPKQQPTPPPAPTSEVDAEQLQALREGARHTRFQDKLAGIAESLRDAAHEVERHAARMERITPTTDAQAFMLDWRTESYSNIASQVMNTVGWMVPNLHLEALALDAACADAYRIRPLPAKEQ